MSLSVCSIRNTTQPLRASVVPILKPQVRYGVVDRYYVGGENQVAQPMMLVRVREMKRREFLKASVASAGLLAAGDEANAAVGWDKNLAGHRIAKFETVRSMDRYPRSLGPNARRGPHGRGYERTFRTVTTDQGAVGFGLCWGPDENIAPFVGAKVGDLFAGIKFTRAPIRRPEQRRQLLYWTTFCTTLPE